jgi:tetratricopeptide (TPR) repeat protein
VQLLLRNLDEAARSAGHLLALDPKSAPSGYLKARTELAQGDALNAERRLEEMIAASPRYWPAYLLLGRINAGQQQVGQAEMYLRAAVNNDSGDDAARVLLAEVYLRENNSSGARSALQGLSGGAGSDSLLSALTGRARLAAGEPAAAREHFDRSEQSPPRSLAELVNVTNVYVLSGEVDRAVRMLETTTVSEPDGAGAIGYLLTLLQLSRGEMDTADVTAQRFTEQQSEEPWALALRATVAMTSGDLATARELYTRALGIDGRYVPAILGLARLEVARADRAEAERHFREVLEIDARQPDAVLGLGQLSLERGDLQQARMWLERAPDSPRRADMLAQLFEQSRFE